ncbi:unnamed protein product [Coccothraustes coccothraustes]
MAPAPRRPNCRRRGRSGRRLPLPKRSNVCAGGGPREGRGRGVGRSGLIANGSGYVDGGRERPASGADPRKRQKLGTASLLSEGVFCCHFFIGAYALFFLRATASRPSTPLDTAGAGIVSWRRLSPGPESERPLGPRSRPPRPPVDQSSAGPRRGAALPPPPAGAARTALLLRPRSLRRRVVK